MTVYLFSCANYPRLCVGVAATNPTGGLPVSMTVRDSPLLLQQVTYPRI